MPRHVQHSAMCAGEGPESASQANMEILLTSVHHGWLLETRGVRGELEKGPLSY